MKLEKVISNLIIKIGFGKLYISENKKIATIKFVYSFFQIFFSYKLLLITVNQVGLTNALILTISLFGIFTGSIILTSALFKVLFNIQPVNEEGNTAEKLQATDSMPLILYWFFTLLIILFPLKGCYDEQRKRTDVELHFYGKTVKIGIKKIYKPYKSGYKAKFFFFNKGELLEKELPANEYKVGDSAYVTFSTENPHIINWTHVLTKEREKQLLDHYKWQRVIINDIYLDSILGKRAKFTYENYGEYFESNLPAKNYKIWDTVEIIFSKENTNIMGWSYLEAISQ
jgi:hypothetical protein